MQGAERRIFVFLRVVRPGPILLRTPSLDERNRPTSLCPLIEDLIGVTACRIQYAGPTCPSASCAPGERAGFVLGLDVPMTAQ